MIHFATVRILQADKEELITTVQPPEYPEGAGLCNSISHLFHFKGQRAFSCSIQTCLDSGSDLQNSFHWPSTRVPYCASGDFSEGCGCIAISEEIDTLNRVLHIGNPLCLFVPIHPICMCPTETALPVSLAHLVFASAVALHEISPFSLGIQPTNHFLIARGGLLLSS
jgi:hypothetical protein